MTLEKQIEILKEWHKRAERYLPVLSSVDIERFLHWLEDYKELKAHFESLPDWIPVLVRCDEALPKKDGEYLCVINGEFKILHYGNGEFYSKCFDGVLRCCNSSVTRWMPLPSKDGINET